MTREMYDALMELLAARWALEYERYRVHDFTNEQIKFDQLEEDFLDKFVTGSK